MDQKFPSPNFTRSRTVRRNRAKDISGLPLVDALRTNPRAISILDMRRLLLEAADEVELLEAWIIRLFNEIGVEAPLKADRLRKVFQAERQDG